MKLKKGDEVKVLIGKDSGRTGKVEKVLPKEDKIVVSGVNMYKRHYKPRKQGEKGGIIDIVKPIDVSKVQLVCPKCKSVARVGFRISDGRKMRVCRKCDQEV